MKLVRFGGRDAERSGMIDAAGAIRDLYGHISAITADNFTGDFLRPPCHHRILSLPKVRGEHY